MSAMPLVPTLFLLVLLIACPVPAQRSSSEQHHKQHRRDDRDQETEGPYTFPRGGTGGGHHRGGNRGHGRGHPGMDERLRSGSTRAEQHNSQRWRVHCAPGTFLNRTVGECVPCARCPVNEIIRRPCGVHRDTICGPFYEFKPGHGGGNPASHYLDDAPRPHHDDGDQRDETLRERAGGDGNVTDVTSEGEGRHGNGNKGGEAADSTRAQEISGAADARTKGPTVQRGAHEWRELCYGLIGALAAVTLLALLYIIVTQIHARRHQSKYSDGHCRTVLSPTMRVFANGLLSNTDYQKIGPYVDGTPTRRPRHWLLKHLRPGTSREHAHTNHYVPEPEIVLGAIPEVVEMERLQRAPLAVIHQGDQGQGAQGQGHAAQGQRLGSTQSWDSGISTHDGNKL